MENWKQNPIINLVRDGVVSFTSLPLSPRSTASVGLEWQTGCGSEQVKTQKSLFSMPGTKPRFLRQQVCSLSHYIHYITPMIPAYDLLCSLSHYIHYITPMIPAYDLLCSLSHYIHYITPMIPAYDLL